MMDKATIRKKEQELIKLTTKFCEAYLNDDHKELTRKVILKLGKEEDVVFMNGNLRSWAAAVIYAIGSLNYLFDSSFEPHVSIESLYRYYGTDQPAMFEKSEKIQKTLGLNLFEMGSVPKNNFKKNPMHDLVILDGFFVPLNALPGDLQEKVKEARIRGLEVEFSSEEG